ncbi:hypothetical protein [Halalkalibacillus sediminis]|uniref:hypothetical protein n=1 Tax=Halalkalibacillus sediminis TaxID=2018042 RepID=UPI00138FBA42|nr:hypothetical protein [Halalkalibacillus sediminis]
MLTSLIILSAVVFAFFAVVFAAQNISTTINKRKATFNIDPVTNGLDLEMEVSHR